SANTTRRSDAARRRAEAKRSLCVAGFGAPKLANGNHRLAGERASARGSALVFEALARNRGLPDLDPFDLPPAGRGEVACGRPPKLWTAEFATFRCGPGTAFKSAPSASTSIRAATLGETAPLRLMKTVGATLN